VSTQRLAREGGDIRRGFAAFSRIDLRAAYLPAFSIGASTRAPDSGHVPEMIAPVDVLNESFIVETSRTARGRSRTISSTYSPLAHRW